MRGFTPISEQERGEPRVLAPTGFAGLGESLSFQGVGVLGKLRYGSLYQWYAVFGALDVGLTWGVLRVGGFEANAFAAWLLAMWGPWALLAIKLATIGIVVAIAEYVGSHRPGLGLFIAVAAIAMNLAPAILGGFYLMMAAPYVQMPDYWLIMWQDANGMFS